MKNLFAWLLVMLFAGSAGAPSTAAKVLEGEHPAEYYKKAAALFKSRATKDEAVFWFYVGQIRYRYHLAANPKLPRDGDPALFASLSEVVGRPINEYAGGDPDKWIAAIDRALAWDASHENAFTPKGKVPQAYREVRAGLVKMRGTVDSSREKLRAARRANGLPVK